MDRSDVSFWLSILGAATGVPLAIIKGIEFYQASRIRFGADVRLTGSEEIGNAVILLNKSSIPATIAYFDLAWVARRSLFGRALPFTRKIIKTDSPIDPPDGYDVEVAAHSTHELYFREEYHFDWGGPLKQDIYLRLWLIGRRSPIWLLVARRGS